MITNSKKWNDPDYYEENFVNIIYDKLTEGMGLSKDERKSHFGFASLIKDTIRCIMTLFAKSLKSFI